MVRYEDRALHAVSDIARLRPEQPYTFGANGSKPKNNLKRDGTGAYLSLATASGLAYLGFKYNPLWFIPSLLLGLFALNELQEDKDNYGSRRKTYPI